LGAGAPPQDQNLGRQHQAHWRGLIYAPFARSASTRSRGNSAAYRALRESEPGLELPDLRTKEAVLGAMLEWERQDPEQCEEDPTDATRLLRAVGGGILRQRFRFVLVPDRVRSGSPAARPRAQRIGRTCPERAMARA
jgi:hypothetical protein